MNKQEYLDLRNGLYEEAETLINTGKVDEANEKIKEITNLDDKFESESKAQANLNALKDNIKVTNISKKGAGNVNGTVLDVMDNVATDDLYNSLDYRKAFMNHVTKGIAMPTEFTNANANTKTTDIGAVIPTTVLQKIVEKMEATGMILPLVTRTAIKGGVSVPISTLKPVATWVAEGATSDRQKKTTGSISFAYYKLRCAVSVSLETDEMALAVFEATLINNVVEAMVKAIEQAILTGSGTGQPKGILTETPVSGQEITIAKATALGYDHLIQAEAAVPLAYENDGVWLMTKKSFMSFIGLVDSQKQPIARVNYGLNGAPERTLLGRRVVLNDYMITYDSTGATTHIFAAIFNLKDYVLNTNLNIGLKRFEDNDTDDQVTKAITLVDGKAVDINSLVTLKKMNA